MTEEQIAAAAMIQTIATQMVTGANERRQPRPGEFEGRKRWNPSHIRRQGQKLLEALEALTKEMEP